MHRTLIVARMEPSETSAVAQIFAESDATELPNVLGVSQRSLFRFHDLYFHLVECESTPDFDEARRNPLFREVSRRLEPHIRPYDPNWQKPQDAMATAFYTWSPGRSAVITP